MASQTPHRQVTTSNTFSRTPSHGAISGGSRCNSPSQRRTPQNQRIVPCDASTPGSVYRTPQTSTSRLSTATTPSTSLQRMSSLVSFASIDDDMDGANEPWGRKDWRQLEIWYEIMDRDVKKASNAFYRHESLQTHTTPKGELETTERWTSKFIDWRCQCLDTNTKYHNGLSPTQRLRLKRKNQAQEGQREEKVRKRK